MDCPSTSRLIGFIAIETAAQPLSRGPVDDDATLGALLARLTGPVASNLPVRCASKSARLPARGGVPRQLRLPVAASLAADLAALEADLDRTLRQARRLAAAC